MDDSLPKIQIVKKSATTALSDLKNNPPGGPVPSSVMGRKESSPKENSMLQEVPVSPDLSSEMKEHGVETTGETIELPQDVEKAGVEKTDNLAVYDPPKENLVPNIPLNSQQMQKGIHAKVADSVLWLVYWCIRQINMSKNK